MKKTISLIILLSLTLCLFASCTSTVTKIEIVGGENITMTVGEQRKLMVKSDGIHFGNYEWISSSYAVYVSQSGMVAAAAVGEATIIVILGDVSDTIKITVIPADGENNDNNDGDGGTNSGDGNGGNDGIDGGNGNNGGGDGTNSDNDVPDDKYIGMSSTEFYKNYQPAVSLKDAQLRAEQGFMAGSLTLATSTPSNISSAKERNIATYFEDNNKTYVVVNRSGEVAMKIYYGGGYISLDEVAAYIYAFGEPPANYDPDKSNKTVAYSDKAIWGKYMRLNDESFSGDVNKYPDQPVLPRISGAGGDYYYHEVDIGGSGYNNGTKITRGALRIVYAKTKSGYVTLTPTERYVFFTGNHYDDFYEYLNYSGGWAPKFGSTSSSGTYTETTKINIQKSTVLSVASLTIPRALFSYEKRKIS